MAEFKHISIGVLIGVLAGGSYYADGQWDPQLLFFMTLTWGTAGWLLARNYHAMNDVTVLTQVLVAGLAAVPLYSIHPELPLGDLRVTLVLHAMGIAVAGIGLGAEIGTQSHSEQRPVGAKPLDE